MKETIDHETERLQVLHTAILRLTGAVEEVNKETGGLSLTEWRSVLLVVEDSLVKEQLRREWRSGK